jgi:hypothetical protein
VHVTLPAAPTAHADLSDEELENAAGGTGRAVPPLPWGVANKKFTKPDFLR